MTLDTSVPYGFYKYDEFMELPYDDQPWLIKPLVPSGGWINIYGQPKKARKSYLAIGMAWAISSGQPNWLGFAVKHPGPVLYLQVDTPHTIWRQRNADIMAGGYDLSNIWFASILTMPCPFNISQHEDQLHEMIQAVPDEPVLIVYDTGRKMHTLDANSSQDMTTFMGALENVSGPTMSKALITHDKKGGGEGDRVAEDEHGQEGGDLMKGNRGSSAVAGAVDTIIKLTPKGYMYYQGRAVGEEHKKLKFTHVHGEMGYMWEEDIDDDTLRAQDLIAKYKQGSERSLARLLAKPWPGESVEEKSANEERARGIIRRLKGK